MKVTELAPAKLNLTLEVGEKRSDGYHEVQSVMSCAALYDEITLESGVGGGIVALYPSRYSIAVWSPRLNSKGNSIMGMKALELFTSETEESIF